MTQVVAFPDPLLAALTIVRASSFAELAPVTFGTKTPKDLGDDFPGAPYGAFRLVSTDDSGHPFREVAAVQLTLWADDEAQALRLVQVVRGVLTAFDGDAEVGSISAGIGPVSLPLDPDNGHPMAFAGVKIRLRPVVLT